MALTLKLGSALKAYRECGLGFMPQCQGAWYQLPASYVPVIEVRHSLLSQLLGPVIGTAHMVDCKAACCALCKAAV
jgi:hypothetical protein